MIMDPKLARAIREARKQRAQTPTTVDEAMEWPYHWRVGRAVWKYTVDAAMKMGGGSSDGFILAFKRVPMVLDKGLDDYAMIYEREASVSAGPARPNQPRGSRRFATPAGPAAAA